MSAALLGALVLALPAASASATAAAPESAPASETAPTTLFGQTVPFADFADSLAAVEDRYGRLGVIRTFNSDGPRLQTRLRPSVISFRYPPPEVLSGQHDAELLTFFRSLPTDAPTWWTYWHEAELAVLTGALPSVPLYQAAFSHIAALARSADNPQVHSAAVMLGWTANPRAPLDPRTLWPMTDVDVLGFDLYDGWSTRQGFYGTPAKELQYPLALAHELGKPWGIAEMGSEVVGSDTAGRADWITTLSQVAYSNAAEFVCYFDSNAGSHDTDYRLTDADSQAAWRAIVSDQQPYPDGQSQPDGALALHR